MNAIVDPDMCTGCGLCPDICPAVFVMDGDVAKAKTDTVPSDVEDACRDAAESCPVDAISIKE
mgnify:CR=1 FL=1